MKKIIQILFLCAAFQLYAQETSNVSNTSDVVLTEETNEHDKVVETALGIKKKKSEITSSQRVVDNEELNNASNPNIISALEGKVSGLRVVRQGLRIVGVILRGATTFRASTYALIVVDGAITSASALQGLDPKNIKSVSVVKGGSGAALYGSQGANGVLVISTKREINLIEEKKQPSNKINKYSGNLKIKKFTNTQGYIRELNKAKSAKDAFEIFETQRENYKNNPAYYADVFAYFSKWNSKNHTKAILNYILQAEPNNFELLKALAFKLEEAKEYDLASSVYVNILKLRPEDSQSFRDLTLIYKETGKEQKAFNLFNSILIDNLNETPSSTASNEMVSMQLVAKNELNNLLQNNPNINREGLNSTHIKNAKYDVRIVLDWNRENADIDLQVIDPLMEMCFYSYPKTQIGGTLTPDVQSAFGPEEYTLRNARPGDYYIKVNYANAFEKKGSLPTFLKITTFKNYGKTNETKEIQVIRLNRSKGDDIVAKIKV